MRTDCACAERCAEDNERTLLGLLGACYLLSPRPESHLCEGIGHAFCHSAIWFGTDGQATWDNTVGKSIVVRFHGDLLSKQKRTDLARFRSRTRTLALRVPGSRERQVSIVGFNVADNAFYLAWL